jgi:hypothetical protein
MKIAGIRLDVESVIAASKREEQQHRKAATRKITSFNI